MTRTTLFTALLSCCIILILTACASDQASNEAAENGSDASTDTTIPFKMEGTLTIYPGGDLSPVTIDIEIADTDSTRARGLMQRSSLPPKSGMLFVFERESPQSFWMANTPLSLDMFFADSNGRIVKVAKYTKPGSPNHIRSGEPAQYVLETPAGFADRYGIIEGDSLDFDRQRSNLDR